MFTAYMYFVKFVLIDLFYWQQAETQIKRRIGIGMRISERRLIDELSRMGMNESIVSKQFDFYFYPVPDVTL